MMMSTAAAAAYSNDKTNVYTLITAVCMSVIIKQRCSIVPARNSSVNRLLEKILKLMLVYVGLTIAMSLPADTVVVVAIRLQPHRYMHTRKHAHTPMKVHTLNRPGAHARDKCQSKRQ